MSHVHLVTMRWGKKEIRISSNVCSLPHLPPTLLFNGDTSLDNKKHLVLKRRESQTRLSEFILLAAF